MIIKKTLQFLILSVFSCFLHRSPFCKDIVGCRGDHVRLAVRVRVFAYPENACAVWLMFACKYCSVLWSTSTPGNMLHLQVNTTAQFLFCVWHFSQQGLLVILSHRLMFPGMREWCFFSNAILAGFSTTRHAILFH